jgi:GNAT superfamily N-acetyltransferase
MRNLVVPAIRPYQPSDSSACRACVVDMQNAERDLDPRLLTGESMADAYLHQMHERCRDHAGTILVAEHAGAIAGLVMILTRVPFESLDEPPGSYALVAELVVRDGLRGHGIGRALLQAAERHAQASGATELRIDVLSANRPARQLYLAERFAPYLETLAKPLYPDA